MQHGLTPERHAEVDARLEAIWTELVELAVEIQDTAALTNKDGHGYTMACRAGDSVRDLREALATEQKNQALGEKIGKRLEK